MAGHRWESSGKGRCDAAVSHVHTPTGEMYPILNIYTSSRGSKVYGARDSIKMTVAPAACFVCAQPGPPARLHFLRDDTASPFRLAKGTACSGIAIFKIYTKVVCICDVVNQDVEIHRRNVCSWSPPFRRHSLRILQATNMQERPRALTGTC